MTEGPRGSRENHTYLVLITAALAFRGPTRAIWPYDVECLLVRGPTVAEKKHDENAAKWRNDWGPHTVWVPTASKYYLPGLHDGLLCTAKYAVLRITV